MMCLFVAHQANATPGVPSKRSRLRHHPLSHQCMLRPWFRSNRAIPLTALETANAVSADYDKVAAVFEDIKSYLHRLKVLEHQVPAVPELELVITEVLTSIMVLCGISTKYIRTKRLGKPYRRLRGYQPAYSLFLTVKALRSLVSGEDADLKAAYDRFHKMVEREEGVVRNTTLVGVTDVKSGMHSAQEDLKAVLAQGQHTHAYLASKHVNNSLTHKDDAVRLIFCFWQIKRRNKNETTFWRGCRSLSSSTGNTPFSTNITKAPGSGYWILTHSRHGSVARRTRPSGVLEMVWILFCFVLELFTLCAYANDVTQPGLGKPSWCKYFMCKTFPPARHRFPVECPFCLCLRFLKQLDRRQLHRRED